MIGGELEIQFDEAMMSVYQRASERVQLEHASRGQGNQPTDDSSSPRRLSPVAGFFLVKISPASRRSEHCTQIGVPFSPVSAPQ